jgi:TonB family protein
VGGFRAPFAALVSLSVHAVAWWGLGATRRASGNEAVRAPTRVEYFQLSPKPAPTPASTRAPDPSPEKAPPKPRASAPTVQPPAAKPPSEAPAAAPADLTGVTLTAPGGSFAVPVGDGSRRVGALAPVSRSAPSLPSTASRNPRAAESQPSEPWVSVRDLSRRPSPPNLAGVLQSNYPPLARAAGLSGRAAVRARIAPNGVARAVRVVQESDSGFGAACRRTVEGSHWTPPLDAHGNPVATDITYRCLFRAVR